MNKGRNLELKDERRKIELQYKERKKQRRGGEKKNKETGKTWMRGREKKISTWKK